MKRKEFIRASGTKGLHKSAIKVQVETPQGKSRTIAYGELTNLAPDKRRTRKRRYTTLTTFGRHGRRKLTFDVVKGTGSLTIAMGFHYDFDVFDVEYAAKMVAFLRVLGYPIHIPIPNPSTIEKGSVQKIGEQLELFVRYYEQQFRDKIRRARISFKRHLKAHHQKRKG